MSMHEEFSDETAETGSDELLSDDHLRLPENASPLVRLHAIRSWLKRRQRETVIEIGEAALQLQHVQLSYEQEGRLRRRELQQQSDRLTHIQQTFTEAQERLQAYEEAEAILEDCVNHTTVGDRLLVEYYLQLEDLVMTYQTEYKTPRIQALADVQQRVEHVGIANEDE
ncbi:hypothetical protein [Tengunoibacter tsumagoiensis]|uniref:Uncharacterized protein n=1 Tax=Tengunoibacter tsumagoiensis TaxID=2014871 RepID=A0A402A2F0_9CHLR|nr:hypothetical protein [Tengunoibacter tsumagoiensis]GCE13320.1 hypothetical protein KTT_31790 [Tengunoibacter tsumagoiensis]